MQVGIKDIKLQSATIVETIIALLILMISFSAGMVIYTKVLAKGVNNEQLRAEAELMFLADSLIIERNADPIKLNRSQRIFEFGYIIDERYPQLMLMKMTCTDGKGLVLVEHLKWVRKHEEGKN